MILRGGDGKFLQCTCAIHADGNFEVEGQRWRRVLNISPLNVWQTVASRLLVTQLQCTVPELVQLVRGPARASVHCAHTTSLHALQY